MELSSFLDVFWSRTLFVHPFTNSAHAKSVPLEEGKHPIVASLEWVIAVAIFRVWKLIGIELVKFYLCLVFDHPSLDRQADTTERANILGKAILHSRIQSNLLPGHGKSSPVLPSHLGRQSNVVLIS